MFITFTYVGDNCGAVKWGEDGKWGRGKAAEPNAENGQRLGDQAGANGGVSDAGDEGRVAIQGSVPIERCN